jgi:hypothetical protein
MAAHGRDHERFQSRLDETLDGGTDNDRQVGDAAAAYAHRDCISFPHARQQAAGFERSARGMCHIVHARGIEPLLDFKERLGQGRLKLNLLDLGEEVYHASSIARQRQRGLVVYWRYQIR